MLEKLGELYRHNKSQAIALMICVCAAIWMFGCDSTVKSIVNPAERVTRTELQNEVDTEVARLQQQLKQVETLAADRNRKLDQMDALKNKVAEIGTIVAEGGTVNPIGAMTSLLAIFGIGAVMDNRKKDGLLTPNPANRSNGVNLN